MTPNMRETMQWLRDSGFMCAGCNVCRKVSAMREFTLDEKTAINRAFIAGNYANAYESTDLESFDLDDTAEIVELCDLDDRSHASIARTAFVLGFFGSYTLDEIGSDREIFDECYFSDVGQYVAKVAGYCDDRSDEYAAEAAEMEE